jgi:glycogen debranching enzyme
VDETIEFESEFTIRVSSGRLDGRTRILKCDDTFAVHDRAGDIIPAIPELGLYHEGTRFLSLLTLTLDGRRPVLLSSHVRQDNSVLVVEMTNPDILMDGRPAVARGTLHLAREIRLFPGGSLQSLCLRNYGLEPFDCVIGLLAGADFADLFEVRGASRARKGRILPDLLEGQELLLSYVGLDGVSRQTRLRCTPNPSWIREGEIAFLVRLKPGEQERIGLTVQCELEPGAAAPGPRLRPRWRSGGSLREPFRIRTSQRAFDEWVSRSTADLQMMITQTAAGPYPYAGVPWFSTPFGRDGIITALEVLCPYPELARGVLAYLAETQATETSPERDAEPGKILHEARSGEMAALGEVPFGRYYGSVDATPLYVMLAAAYFERTGDGEFLDRLWPSIERALCWIEGAGDRDGDGFVEYFRQSATGLIHQGWKDSHDAISHEDGCLAEGPIAVCEAQGYVYAALRGAAELAAVRGDGARAAALNDRASSLREKFDRAFWCEDLASYALALDGAKEPCRVRASNAGHALWTGIAFERRAPLLCRTLLDPASFSGWGIRTLASTEKRYNPMSYHNGSLWPHDNALIAAGLARYGCKAACARLLEAFFDLSRVLDLRRLPELLCGFERRAGDAPTRYPLSCAPQSWAAGAVFLMLQGCLGISIRGAQRRVQFDRPFLPAFLDWVRLEDLRVGDETVDVFAKRRGDQTDVEILRGAGGVRLSVWR